jgi:predicted metal-dependent peptidase
VAPISVEVSPEAARRGALDKIAAARVWLLKEKPFFGVLARALVVEPSETLASAFRLYPTDRLEVHPRAVLALPFMRLCARLSHLCLHAALGAYARRRERTPARWNLAHDIAIEPLLREAGLPAASGEVPESLRVGLSAEEVYEQLPENAAPIPEWCDLVDAPPRETEERSPPPGAPRNAESLAETPPPDQKPPGEGEGEGDDGSEPPHESHDAEASAPHEVRARELAWKMRLAEALEVERASGGKTWGAIPSWIDALVSAQIAPPPSWTVALQTAVAALSRSERTFMRPSRRQSAMAFDNGEEWPEVVSMPGRRVVPGGRLVAIVDTSASIDERVMAVALGAVASAATAEGVEEVRLMQADAEVTSDEVVSPADLLMTKIPIRGRGGTSFAPALLLLAREARRSREPFTAVYLTDLDGAFPSKKAVQGIDVLWVTTVVRPVPFGKVVPMR